VTVKYNNHYKISDIQKYQFPMETSGYQQNECHRSGAWSMFLFLYVGFFHEWVGG
jgi:hypothetical protein